jgi:ABC-type uncharacterized transport system permease subunit
MFFPIKKFWCVFRPVLIERMVHRINFIMEIISEILSSLIVIFLWMAIYRVLPVSLHSGRRSAQGPVGA